MYEIRPFAGKPSSSAIRTRSESLVTFLLPPSAYEIVSLREFTLAIAGGETHKLDSQSLCVNVPVVDGVDDSSSVDVETSFQVRS
jgi:hypothetical protein